LKGHYWICGQYVYRRLPPNWSGICYVGYIRPLFFLLPQIQGNKLGIKVYDDLIRERRSVDPALTAGSSQTWGGWNMDWFTSWVPQLGWLREGLLLFILFITTLLTLACFAPCVVALVRRMANQIIHQQMMALYQPVKAEDWGP
ncbi:endogenous retrovirus group 3 member 1, partial [Chelydra serpentina]